MTTERRRRIDALGDFVLRSLYPFVACTLLVATMWLGPWWLLVATLVWWRIVTRIA